MSLKEAFECTKKKDSAKFIEKMNEEVNLRVVLALEAKKAEIFKTILENTLGKSIKRGAGYGAVGGGAAGAAAGAAAGHTFGTALGHVVGGQRGASAGSAVGTAVGAAAGGVVGGAAGAVAGGAAGTVKHGIQKAINAFRKKKNTQGNNNHVS